MELVAQSHSKALNRLGAAVILAAIVAALAMAIAAPAQAAPYTATAWGDNESGQLGNGTTTGPEECGQNQTSCSATPVAVSDLSGVTAVDGGNEYGLALLENGTVKAWGANIYGQLGNGTTNNSDVPVAVKELSGVTAIAAGGTFGLALLSNGTVMAWGRNAQGQLGDGTTNDSDVPVAVSGLSEVTAIAGGENHSLAVLKDGTVMAWGQNAAGQLGDGTTTNRNVPVAVSGLSGVSGVAAGSVHSLALLASGAVMAWGDNKFGQLGNGSTTKSNVPVAVSGLSGVSAVSAGAYHGLALLGNGSVMAWGENVAGELGDGTSTGPEQCGVPPLACAKTPVAVSGLSGVSAVAGGAELSLALLSNGTVKAWGANGYGQLGVGTSTGPEACTIVGPCSTTPVEVSKPGDAKGIGAGDRHSLAFGPPPPSGPLPELGRCVKSAAHTGKYKYSNCVAVNAKGKGAWEWLPGPGGTNNKYVATLNKFKLQTVGGNAVQCGGFITGEYKDSKTATVELEMKGCLNLATHQRCQGPTPEPGEINAPFGGLEAEIGFIKGGARPIVGWDIKPKKEQPSPNVLEFTCGTPVVETVENWSVEGSVIGALKGIDKMTSIFKLTYNATGGKQERERFEGGAKDTLLAKITTVPTTGPPSNVSEQAGLVTRGETAPFEIENGEPLEIKAK